MDGRKKEVFGTTAVAQFRNEDKMARRHGDRSGRSFPFFFTCLFFLSCCQSHSGPDFSKSGHSTSSYSAGVFSLSESALLRVGKPLVSSPCHVCLALHVLYHMGSDYGMFLGLGRMGTGAGSRGVWGWGFTFSFCRLQTANGKRVCVHAQFPDNL
ncbi:hypothetical protein P153DRAFT_11771 [Dothidotthia symphoricarpi CBS 119687]|uniref:Uncharacterized protein n=1 Tax=Dothidotthia symphoricarpi CBS 119687 TaxID=1392245 RepID=A0A6A6ASF6_9PLEO|nr:uncharacterized protein P153DRAFT_11771 [Dothidotthia symphoricarpi CBS 119687]KAF2134879.1 hypothetical protein P153DRAFT_11771 [Dothidotthia symphoricarpi CBS 119687]